MKASEHITLYHIHCLVNMHVYAIAWVVVKFGINFTICIRNGNKFAQGAAEGNFEGNFAILATMSGIYPKISLLPMP